MEENLGNSTEKKAPNQKIVPKVFSGFENWTFFCPFFCPPKDFWKSNL
jgi:hypothetical protein